MARLSLDIKKTQDKKKLLEFKSRASTKVENNTIVSSRGKQSAAKVQRLAKKMSDNRTIEPTEVKTTQALSLKILSAAGCSLVESIDINRAEYSLISDQIDTEVVENPNKIDPKQFANIKKAKISIDKIFKTTDDSIFKLDTDLPNNYKEQSVKSMSLKTLPLTNIVSTLYDVSFNVQGVSSLRALKG